MYLICVLFGLVLLYYFYYIKHSNYWRKLGVPCAPNTHWFFGNYTEIFFGTRNAAAVFQDIYNAYPDAPYVGYMKISNPGLLIKEPELIKAILTTDFNSFSKNELMIDKKVDFLFGNNPFTLYGEEWKMARGHATPLVTYTKLKNYTPYIIEVGKKMVSYLKEKCGDRIVEFDTKTLANMYTTDVLANAILGMENDTFKNENSLFASLTKEILDGSFLSHIKIMLSFMFPERSGFLRLRLASKRAEEILLSLTKRIMKHRRETKETRNDLFQQMIANRENDIQGVFTDKYIASHCFNFIIDGYETSGDLICFTLFELAWNNEVQINLRNEIINMIDSTNGDYNIDDIENMKYLDMVVSEALRKHAPLLQLSKICTTDYTLPSLTKGSPEIILKKNTAVTIPTYAIHRDPKLYPEPEKFDPERFTEEAKANRHKFVYLPFGDGPRRCLGLRFGSLQTKIAIINIISNFKLKPSAQTQYNLEIDPKVFINRPLGGAYIYFEELNSAKLDNLQ